MAQRGHPFGLGITIAGGGVVVVLMVWGSGSILSTPVSGALLGWILMAVVAIWISRSIPRVARRIYSIGTAHRAERQASETEAQRRQGARLLHDTVLATLTLLAHSGVGVSEQAMREQAAEDARLLRHLRLGATPQPSQSGDYSLTREEESPLGQTLESVKQRFGPDGPRGQLARHRAGPAAVRTCSTRSCSHSASAWRTSVGTPASARHTSRSSTTTRSSEPWSPTPVSAST
ncbi:hypothetical protein Q9Q99_04680 [Curtobacterium flaccumfaciens]|nr:hypothetical protein Q9Q99_04680 [Curtobacterium flaccumfaciens]